MSATPGRLLAIGAIFAILSESMDKSEGSTSKAVTRTYIVVVLLAHRCLAASNRARAPKIDAAERLTVPNYLGIKWRARTTLVQESIDEKPPSHGLFGPRCQPACVGCGGSAQERRHAYVRRDRGGADDRLSRHHDLCRHPCARTPLFAAAKGRRGELSEAQARRGRKLERLAGWPDLHLQDPPERRLSRRQPADRRRYQSHLRPAARAAKRHRFDPAGLVCRHRGDRHAGSHHGRHAAEGAGRFFPRYPGPAL